MPAPPYSCGKTTPSKPILPSSLMVASGNSPASSHSMTCGLISRSANSRTLFFSCSCSSFSRKSTVPSSTRGTAVRQFRSTGFLHHGGPETRGKSKEIRTFVSAYLCVSVVNSFLTGFVAVASTPEFRLKHSAGRGRSYCRHRKEKDDSNRMNTGDSALLSPPPNRPEGLPNWPATLFPRQRPRSTANYTLALRLGMQFCRARGMPGKLRLKTIARGLSGKSDRRIAVTIDCEQVLLSRDGGCRVPSSRKPPQSPADRHRDSNASRERNSPPMHSLRIRRF